MNKDTAYGVLRKTAGNDLSILLGTSLAMSPGEPLASSVSTERGRAPREGGGLMTFELAVQGRLSDHGPTRAVTR